MTLMRDRQGIATGTVFQSEGESRERSRRKAKQDRQAERLKTCRRRKPDEPKFPCDEVACAEVKSRHAAIDRINHVLGLS